MEHIDQLSTPKEQSQLTIADCFSTQKEAEKYNGTSNKGLNHINIVNSISDEDIWNFLDICVNDENVIEKSTDDSYCKHCNTNNMIIDDNKSKYTCNNCGIEDNEIFDTRPEWNNYDDSTPTTGRCGVAINLFLPRSSTGTIISGSGYSRVRLLQSWNQMPYKERSLSTILHHIEFSLKKFKITKAIIDNAKILYKNISDLKHTSGINKDKYIITRGINRYGIIAACAYYGAKLQNQIRTIREIAEIFNLKLPQLTRGCRKFLNLLADKTIIANITSSQPYEFINRFASKLKLDEDQINTAINISKNITKLDIASDHQPLSLAAASLLLTANIYELNINKRTIADILGISEVTVIKTYKNIHQYKKIIINNRFTNIVYNKIQEKIKNDTSLSSADSYVDKNDTNDTSLSSADKNDTLHISKQKSKAKRNDIKLLGIKCSEVNFNKLFLPYNEHDLSYKYINAKLMQANLENLIPKVPLPRGRPRKIVPQV